MHVLSRFGAVFVDGRGFLGDHITHGWDVRRHQAAAGALLWKPPRLGGPGTLLRAVCAPFIDTAPACVFLGICTWVH